MDEVGDEEECDGCRTHEVDSEDIEDLGTVKENKEEDIERDVHQDEEHLQSRELQRALLVPQIAEWYGLEGVEGCHHAHHEQILRMGGVAEG